MPSDGQPRDSPDERGFTLIDLLFVIALIGLLSALALPRLTCPNLTLNGIMPAFGLPAAGAPFK